MIRVASFDRQRPNVSPSVRISLGVGEPLAIRRKGIRKGEALTPQKALRAAGAIRADPGNFPLARFISDVLAIRTPDRVVVTWSTGEPKKIVSWQIHNPQTSISGKQGDREAIAIGGKSGRQIKTRTD